MYPQNKDYIKARDLAWKVLIHFKVSALPVNISGICRGMGINIYTYRDNEKLLDLFKLRKYADDNDGFSARINGHYVIFYDDSVTPRSRVRFTVAHELGHILLGHVRSEVATRWNNGEKHPTDPRETAANQFAVRLLAPACVLYELDVHTTRDLMRLTGLSYTAAEYRLIRLNELRAREKFYTSGLERQVRNQFRDFIETQKQQST
jgi:Zn-dependent peptidase ImmA (M78 family)